MRLKLNYDHYQNHVIMRSWDFINYHQIHNIIKSILNLLVIMTTIDVRSYEHEQNNGINVVIMGIMADYIDNSKINM